MNKNENGYGELELAYVDQRTKMRDLMESVRAFYQGECIDSCTLDQYLHIYSTFDPYNLMSDTLSTWRAANDTDKLLKSIGEKFPEYREVVLDCENYTHAKRHISFYREIDYKKLERWQVWGITNKLTYEQAKLCNEFVQALMAIDAACCKATSPMWIESAGLPKYVKRRGRNKQTEDLQIFQLAVSDETRALAEFVRKNYDACFHHVEHSAWELASTGCRNLDVKVFSGIQYLQFGRAKIFLSYNGYERPRKPAARQFNRRDPALQNRPRLRESNRL